MSVRDQVFDDVRLIPHVFNRDLLCVVIVNVPS